MDLTKDLGLRGTGLETITELLYAIRKDLPEDISEGASGSEEWEIRHNQEIWRTTPSAVHEVLPPEGLTLCLLI
jgi:hypothetical protein